MMMMLMMRMLIELYKGFKPCSLGETYTNKGTQTNTKYKKWKDYEGSLCFGFTSRKVYLCQHRYQSNPVTQGNNFILLFYFVSATDECKDGVDSCEMTKDPVGMNKDGHLCYGKK